MTTNNSWQNQGRQQHGWFGTGTGIQQIADGPVTYPQPKPEPIRGVYPLEYLIGLLSGASLLRAAASAAIRNFGPASDAGAAGRPSPPGLNVVKQNKHIPGTNNYILGRSILTADPIRLLATFARRGRQIGSIPVGQAGSKEAFDAGKEIIGFYVSKEGVRIPTSRGMIIYDSQYLAHIVPIRP